MIEGNPEIPLLKELFSSGKKKKMSQIDMDSSNN